MDHIFADESLGHLESSSGSASLSESDLSSHDVKPDLSSWANRILRSPSPVRTFHHVAGRVDVQSVDRCSIRSSESASSNLSMMDDLSASQLSSCGSYRTNHSDFCPSSGEIKSFLRTEAVQAWLDEVLSLKQPLLSPDSLNIDPTNRNLSQTSGVLLSPETEKSTCCIDDIDKDNRQRSAPKQTHKAHTNSRIAIITPLVTSYFSSSLHNEPESPDKESGASQCLADTSPQSPRSLRSLATPNKETSKPCNFFRPIYDPESTPTKPNRTSIAVKRSTEFVQLISMAEKQPDEQPSAMSLLTRASMRFTAFDKGKPADLVRDVVTETLRNVDILLQTESPDGPRRTDRVRIMGEAARQIDTFLGMIIQDQTDLKKDSSRTGTNSKDYVKALEKLYTVAIQDLEVQLGLGDAAIETDAAAIDHDHAAGDDDGAHPVVKQDDSDFDGEYKADDEAGFGNAGESENPEREDDDQPRTIEKRVEFMVWKSLLTMTRDLCSFAQETAQSQTQTEPHTP